MPLSLVAFYGEKPSVMRHLIVALQRQLSDALAGAFRPYTPAQVHGTIIGMEMEEKDGLLYSRWCRENLGVSPPVDLAGLLDHLQGGLPAMELQIGGYRSRRHYGFTSQGRHPYLRSFGIRGDTAVAMGWPVTASTLEGDMATALFAWRHSFEAFHLCHKWHRDDYRDNDFFFVLGKVNTDQLGPASLRSAEESIRESLAQRPTLIRLGKEQLSLVAYRDTELPPGSTEAFPLSGALPSERKLRELALKFA